MCFMFCRSIRRSGGDNHIEGPVGRNVVEKQLYQRPGDASRTFTPAGDEESDRNAINGQVK